MSFWKFMYYACGVWIFKLIFWIICIVFLAIPFALMHLIRKT